jgi:hypothetical protein
VDYLKETRRYWKLKGVNIEPCTEIVLKEAMDVSKDTAECVSEWVNGRMNTPT